MKSIRTLLRLKQQEIDALKQQQSKLESQREILFKTIDMLAESLASELKTAQAMPEMAHFFGDFSAHIKKRQEQVHTHLRRLEQEMEKLAAQIRDRFGELKTFEIALENYEKRKKTARSRAEQIELDEIALRGFTRKDDAV